jgi:hypothetical protein
MARSGSSHCELDPMERITLDGLFNLEHQVDEEHPAKLFAPCQPTQPAGGAASFSPNKTVVL